jgi:hypothetical protein
MHLASKPKDQGTTDESIGRPGPWREGRYQRRGQSLEDSVEPDQPLDSKRPLDAPTAPQIPEGPVSTAVHLDEYTSVAAKPPAAKRKPKRS